MPDPVTQGPTLVRTGLAFVLIDGLGDTNLKQLDHRTPLQTADTQTLDGIAGKKNGSQGVVQSTVSA